MSNINEAEIKEITRKYRLLRFLPPNILQGQVDLIINGNMYHRFDLTVQIHPDHPFRFPIVWETGDDIPRTMDRHVFPKTGNLCFGVIAEERLVCKDGIRLAWFFDKVLLPRLADEFCVINGGEYQKEKSHGIVGDWEFYFSELNTQNPAFVLTILTLLKLVIPPKSTDPCPCGSGISFNTCHEKNLGRIILGTHSIAPSFWNGEIQKLKIRNGQDYIL